jgi:hypothetical protein
MHYNSLLTLLSAINCCRHSRQTESTAMNHSPATTPDAFAQMMGKVTVRLESRRLDEHLLPAGAIEFTNS